MDQFRADMRRNIQGWENDLANARECQNGFLHPLQRAAFDRMIAVLQGFIHEGKTLLADLAPLR
jgi:hypothetical protein